MKKKRILIGIICASILFFTGCGLDGVSDTKSNQSSEPQDAEKIDDESVKINDDIISLEDKMSDVRKILGDANDVTEAKSCMYEGYDRTYTYDNLNIVTNEAGDDEIVNSISFTDERYEIKCGIHVGDLATDIPDSLEKGVVSESESVNTYEFSDYGIALYLENQHISQIELYTITE